ncbi:hypothetical protein WH96_20350 [Kiloniella spongiae]|uniref:TRAP transporter small permease protein n=1 Tax=Kiloniella spongiae TaxID=1489064 RepID=A0A0H2M9X6_9PROT|nr:TRAP transporter small permease subunit [Kiloniella spongiae]KLN58941.1 hypothetical protein WH96_20350 [Kiloniella spongiae]
MQRTSYFNKCEEALAVGIRSAIFVASIALALVMVAQVFMRYVLESPSLAIEETTTLFGVWGYFLGMVYTTRSGEHIYGGVLSLIVKDKRVLHYVRGFNSLVCFVATSIFGYFGLQYLLFVIERGKISINLGWPRDIWVASIVVGFALMAFYFLLQTSNEFRNLRAIKEEREADQ